MDSGKCVGKVAIVTGASSGIGAAIACKLVEEGMKVVGFARRVERIEEMAKKCAGKKGKLYGCKVDITNEQDVCRGIQYTCEKIGTPCVLVNNAGVWCDTTIMEGSTEKWKCTFDTNVMGLLMCTREVLKCMKKNNVCGHIININSLCGHYFCKMDCKMNVYGASKMAVTNITETLRCELAACKCKTKVTSISPGPVCTEMLEKCKQCCPKFKEACTKMQCLQPEDVACAVCFALCQPERVQVHELMIRPCCDCTECC